MSVAVVPLVALLAWQPPPSAWRPIANRAGSLRAAAPDDGTPWAVITGNLRKAIGQAAALRHKFRCGATAYPELTGRKTCGTFTFLQLRGSNLDGAKAADRILAKRQQPLANDADDRATQLWASPWLHVVETRERVRE